MNKATARISAASTFESVARELSIHLAVLRAIRPHLAAKVTGCRTALIGGADLGPFD